MNVCKDVNLEYYTQGHYLEYCGRWLLAFPKDEQAFINTELRRLHSISAQYAPQPLLKETH
jgi:hypothetical protein